MMVLMIGFALGTGRSKLASTGRPSLPAIQQVVGTAEFEDPVLLHAFNAIPNEGEIRAVPDAGTTIYHGGFAEASENRDFEFQHPTWNSKLLNSAPGVYTLNHDSGSAPAHASLGHRSIGNSDRALLPSPTLSRSHQNGYVFDEEKRLKMIINR